MPEKNYLKDGREKEVILFQNPPNGIGLGFKQFDFSWHLLNFKI